MTAQVATPRQQAGLGSAALAGLGFGLTSGVLTTLGLMVGLNAGTSSKAAVAAGIATIAVADAFSDALGVRVSQEAGGAARSNALLAAAATLLAKMIFALTFLVPVLLLPLDVAVAASVVWGLGLISVFAWSVARWRGRAGWLPALEHLGAAVLVLSVSQGAGMAIAAIA
jgi:hypothetical protein